MSRRQKLNFIYHLLVYLCKLDLSYIYFRGSFHDQRDLLNISHQFQSMFFNLSIRHFIVCFHSLTFFNFLIPGFNSTTVHGVTSAIPLEWKYPFLKIKGNLENVQYMVLQMFKCFVVDNTYYITALHKILMFRHQITPMSLQWNLDIRNLYIIKSSV